jgi:small GTP-binding protein
MLISYTTNAFPPNYVRTVFEDYTAEVMLNGKPIKLVLKDTSGQSQLDRLRPLSYTKANVFMLLYSVVSPISLQNPPARPQSAVHCGGDQD